ncbi:DUF551 domain-containing protein [Klebsiella pneumoniae]|uniref:DUF551 domain-containing protein n=2 Tax=Klebsiella pneumoniae TaxID=573 RepID=UPI0039824144
MTSKLTRERLQEIAEDGFLKHGESKELARIALAAMDSEPVAWTWQHLKQWHVTNDEARARDLAWDGVKVEPLYRHAQSAPVVPEEKSIPNTLSMCAVDAVAAIAEVKGWNACRAAMLQELKKSAGTEAICRSDENVQVLHTKSPAQSDCCPAQNSVTPVQNKGWIPVSEQMPDNTEPVLCIEKRADFGTYGQPFVCWHDGGGWVGKTNYRPIVTHWMPLPAGPQEVTNGK